MKILHYKLELLEPCLVTSLQGDPNSGVAYSYLPGAVLRGVFAGAYLRHNKIDPAQSEATEPVFRRLFLDGSTRFLNGYIDIEGKRALPVPKSWHREKHQARFQPKTAPIFDFVVNPAPEIEDEPSPQWKGKGGYWIPSSGKAYRIKPERTIAVHTARNRRMGRAAHPDAVNENEDAGAVYRYDALAAGQTFVAAILCQDGDEKLLEPLLTGEILIGGARSGGYGRTRITHLDTLDSWQEVEPPAQSSETLTVTLLSDALFRDENGLYAVDAELVRQAVAKKLGCLLELERAYTGGTAVGGFNQKWGLPIPQALAVSMGSVFVFRTDSSEKADLDKLLNEGIGERRAEGFGRVAVNWHTKEKWRLFDPDKDKTEEEHPDPVALPPGSPSEKVAQVMASRLLRQKLNTRLAQAVKDKKGKLRGPQASQLNRLRQVIRDVLGMADHQKGKERLAAYYQGLEKRQVTRKQFDTRFGNQKLLAWLREVSGATGLHNDLKLAEDDIPAIGATKADADALAYEYNLRYLDAVLAQAAKEKEG